MEYKNYYSAVAQAVWMVYRHDTPVSNVCMVDFIPMGLLLFLPIFVGRCISHVMQVKRGQPSNSSSAVSTMLAEAVAEQQALLQVESICNALAKS